MPGGQAAVMRATAAVSIDGRRTGSAVLVDPRYLLTAAHVLQSRNPDKDARIAAEQVGLEFSGRNLGAVTASCLSLGPAAAGVDIAVLDLGEDRPGWLPAPVLVWPTARPPSRVQVFGYPLAEGALNGVWRQFAVAGPTTEGKVQLDWIGDAGTFPGHSGGPVIDADGHTLAGILVEGAEQGRFDRFVPITLIAQAWPRLPRPWLMTGADSGEARSHFIRRSRGQRSTARGGDLFRGRRRALNRITGWLTAGEPPGRPLVVTGQPGAGKSAVLARAALSVEAEHGGPGLAFHARAATVGDFLTALADLIGADAPTSADDLVPSLIGLPRQPPLRVVVDALDEAVSDRDQRQIAAALAELAVLPGLRIAVATRPLAASNLYAAGGLLAVLGVTTRDDHNLIDLDTDAYFDRDGLRQFAAALLAQDGMDYPGPPGAAWKQYRARHEVRDRLAAVVAERAGRNFLVAAMAAVPLSAAHAMIDPAAEGFDHAGIPSGVGEALSKYLEQLPDQRRERDRGLLTALAYARGAGLDDPAWLSFATALGYSAAYADLDALRHSRAADYLLQTTTADRRSRPVTRLFHQALTDELLGARHRPSDEGALFDVLLDQAERIGWQVNYLREHAAEHAAAIGRLDQLLEDPDYLLHADMTRLLPLLPAQAESPEAGIVSVLGLAGSVAAKLSPVPRARQFALAAAHLGLAELRCAFATRVADGWVPSWAHSLVPHQSLAGHNGSVRAVAIGQLGERDVIVSAGDDGTVRLWDTAGVPRRSLTGHDGPVRAVAIGRAGNQDVIVSGGDDGTVRVWDATGAPTMEPLTGHDGPVRAVAIGRAGERDVIVSGGDHGIRMWEGTTGQILEPSWFRLSGLGGAREMGDVSNVRGLAIGRAGSRDVIVSVGDRSEVWDAARRTRIGELDTTFSHPLTAAVIGKIKGRDVIVSANRDNEVESWNPAHPAGGPERMGWAAGPLRAITIGQVAGQQLIVAGGADGVIWAWDAAAQRPTVGPLARQTLARQATTINAIAIGRARGRDVIVSGGRDGMVRVWDATPHRHGGDQLPGHISRVETVAAGTIDGRDVVISGGEDGFRVWDPATGQAISDLFRDGLFGDGRGLGSGVKAVSIGWSRYWNRNVIIVASHDGEINFYDGLDCVPLRAPPPLGWRANARRPGEVIVTSGRDGVWSWNPGTPVRVPQLIFPGAVYVTPVAVGQIGGIGVVVSGHQDGVLRIWDLALTAIDSLATHDSRMTAIAIGKIGGEDVIVTGCADGGVRVWDPAAKQPHGERLADHPRPVIAVAAGRAGGRDVIVSGSTDRKVRIWDVATGRRETLEMLDSVTGLAVSTNYLAVASGTTIAVFSVPGSAPAATGPRATS